MQNKVTFSAQSRSVVGKKSGVLRRSGQIPANIMGDVEQSIAITINSVGFDKLHEEVGETGLVYLTVDGEKKERPVLVAEVQQDPISGRALHVVFRQVDLTEKVEAEVPVEVVGELQVKNALVVNVQDAIMVKALPQDLPEKFEIDISQFTEFGQMITFNQLQYDRTKVTLMVEEDQLDTPVVLVQEVKEEAEPVVEAAPTEGAEGTAPAGEANAEAAPTAEEKKE